MTTQEPERYAENRAKELARILEMRSPGAYSGLEYLASGNTADVFVSFFHRAQKRAIKWDKPRVNGGSFVTTRNLEKGLDGKNAFERSIGFQSSSLNGVLGVHDYVSDDVMRQHGLEGTVIIGEYFDGMNLEDRVALARENPKKNPITKHEFAIVGRKVLNAMRYLAKEHNTLHRDIKPSNVLVSKDGLDARLADYGNAGLIDNLAPAVLPTIPSHTVVDPLLIGGLTGEKRTSSIKSEIYSWGATMFYFATGSFPFSFDPENLTAKNIEGRDILAADDSGLPRLDHSRYMANLGTALNRLPSWAKPYRDVLEKAMFIYYEEGRYDSLDKVIEDFDKASKSTVLERARKNPLKTIATTIGATTIAAGLAFGSYNYVDSMRDSLEEKAARAKLPVLEGNANYADIGVENDLFNIQTSVTNEDPSTKKWRWYPNDSSFLAVKPGDKLWLTVAGNEKNVRGPRSKDTPVGCMVRAYFEGHESANGLMHTIPRDDSGYWQWAMGSPSANIILTVPQDLPVGVSFIHVEAYAPNFIPNDNHVELGEESINVTKPGYVVETELIPVLFGSVADTLKLKEFSLGEYVTNQVKLVDIDTDEFMISSRVLKNIDVRGSISSLGLNEIIGSSDNTFSNVLYRPVNLPKNIDDVSSEDVGKPFHVARFSWEYKGKEIGRVSLPLSARIDSTYNRKNLVWEMAVTDSSFYRALLDESTGKMNLRDSAANIIPNSGLLHK